jgi:magnesium transporter
MKNAATIDISADWDTLRPEEKLASFRALDREAADDFFLSLESRQQAELLQLFPPGERRLWMRLLDPDDAADALQEVEPAVRSELLGELDEATRREVAALLAYREDQAGGLMSPRFARVRPESTVDEAIAYLRLQAPNVETIHYAYALDGEQHLLGVVPFRLLFAAPPERRVADIMRTRIVSVAENADQEEVAALFAKLHVFALPVVDAENRMVGIVTVDDAVDVVQQEASEDIQKLGGSEALDEPYLKIAFLRMIRKRGGWLTLLLLGEMLTATAMARYEEHVAKAAVLAMFIPLIISSGGNSGSQAATLVIQAMALGQLRLRDWWRVVRREVGAGLLLGAGLGAIGLGRIVLWQALWGSYGEHASRISLTVGFSLLSVVLLGTIAGSMLPFLLRRAGVDPASASTPFVATLVDVAGVVLYFTIATLLLRGYLL